MLLPNIFRTTAAVLAGTFLYMAFNPVTLLRLTIFGVLAIGVFLFGWAFADYIETVEEHNFHVTAQFVTLAEQAEHRADWHYSDRDVEVCDIHGSGCPTFQGSAGKDSGHGDA